MDNLRNTCAKCLRIVAFVIAGHARSVFGQADDLQQLVHEKVNSQQAFAKFEGKNWQAEKKTLARYSEEQIVHALFAEFDIAEGNPLEKDLRDFAAAGFFEEMHLSPTPVCQELDKSQTPQRKTSLMRMLWRVKSPEVTQALLRQLKDLRPGAMEMQRMPELGTPHPWRVCDIAFNSLIINLQVEGSFKVDLRQTDERKDVQIQKMLTKLGLYGPNDTPK